MVTGGHEVTGFPEPRFEPGDAVLEVLRVGGLLNDEQCAAEFLEEEEGCFHRSVQRAGALAVRANLGFEAPIFPLMGERGIDPSPGVVCLFSVSRNHREDQRPAASPLRAGFQPLAQDTIAAGQTVGVGPIA